MEIRNIESSNGYSRDEDEFAFEDVERIAWTMEREGVDDLVVRDAEYQPRAHLVFDPKANTLTINGEQFDINTTWRHLKCLL